MRSARSGSSWSDAPPTQTAERPRHQCLCVAISGYKAAALGLGFGDRFGGFHGKEPSTGWRRGSSLIPRSQVRDLPCPSSRCLQFGSLPRSSVKYSPRSGQRGQKNGQQTGTTIKQPIAIRRPVSRLSRVRAPELALGADARPAPRRGALSGHIREMRTRGEGLNNQKGPSMRAFP
jgi:hypothetical protein